MRTAFFSGEGAKFTEKSRPRTVSPWVKSASMSISRAESAPISFARFWHSTVSVSPSGSSACVSGAWAVSGSTAFGSVSLPERASTQH